MAGQRLPIEVVQERKQAITTKKEGEPLHSSMKNKIKPHQCRSNNAKDRTAMIAWNFIYS